MRTFHVVFACLYVRVYVRVRRGTKIEGTEAPPECRWEHLSADMVTDGQVTLYCGGMMAVLILGTIRRRRDGFLDKGAFVSFVNTAVV